MLDGYCSVRLRQPTATLRIGLVRGADLSEVGRRIQKKGKHGHDPPKLTRHRSQKMRSMKSIFLSSARAALIVVAIAAVAALALEEDEGRPFIQVQLDYLPGKRKVAGSQGTVFLLCLVLFCSVCL